MLKCSTLIILEHVKTAGHAVLLRTQVSILLQDNPIQGRPADPAQLINNYKTRYTINVSTDGSDFASKICGFGSCRVLPDRMNGRASMFSALLVHNCGKELAGFHARFLSCFTGRVHSSAHLHAQAVYEEIMPTQGAAQPSPARFGVEARLERSRAGPPQLLFGPVRGWVSSRWAKSCVWSFLQRMSTHMQTV